VTLALLAHASGLPRETRPVTVSSPSRA